MELFVLDALHRREHLIESYESLIWTERFTAFGDFELVINPNNPARKWLLEGTRLLHVGSARLMEVETLENGRDEQGKAFLKVTGRSLEKLLDDRVAKDTMSNLTVEPKWILTGTPGNIMRQIFQDICVTGTLSTADIIPMVTPGDSFPPSTVDEWLDPVTVELEPQTVYKALQDLGNLYNLGFRLYRRHGELEELHFGVYAGIDRTTQQTLTAPVIFAPELDNLHNTTELNSVALEKNVAYVFSPVGFAVVYPTGIDPTTVTGFNRRVLLVKADDITAETVNPTAAMQEAGRIALSDARKFTAFDGELTPKSLYRYGVDYELGDLVEMRNADGLMNTMRVTEQIFVSDEQGGDRSYPTLTINRFVEPGSWISWDYNQVWADLGVDEFWADQP